jgi:hypothetical protein
MNLILYLRSYKMAKKLFDELKIEKKEKSKEFIGYLMKSGLINDVEEYIKEVYTDQSLKLKLNPFEFFNHKVKTLHEKYVTLLNYDEEEFEQIIILHAYFNLNLTEKSFLEIWNKYQQGEYNDLLEEDEEDFEDDLDWGD